MLGSTGKKISVEFTLNNSKECIKILKNSKLYFIPLQFKKFEGIIDFLQRLKNFALSIGCTEKLTECCSLVNRAVLLLTVQ